MNNEKIANIVKNIDEIKKQVAKMYKTKAKLSEQGIENKTTDLVFKLLKNIGEGLDITISNVLESKKIFNDSINTPSTHIKKLKNYSEKLEITQEEIANILKTSLLAIAEHEREQNKPNITTLKEIACILNVYMDAFNNGKKDTPKYFGDYTNLELTQLIEKASKILNYRCNSKM